MSIFHFIGENSFPGVILVIILISLYLNSILNSKFIPISTDYWPLIGGVFDDALAAVVWSGLPSKALEITHDIGR